MIPKELNIDSYPAQSNLLTGQNHLRDMNLYPVPLE